MRRLSLASVFAAWAASATAGESTQPKIDKPALNERISRYVRDTATATWVHDSWESKGKKTSEARSKCFWLRDGRLRVEVLDGEGSGSTVVLVGDRVTVKPFGIFGLFRVHYKVTDDTVRSLRGFDLAHMSFIDDLTAMLESWNTVELSSDGDAVVVSYNSREPLPTRAWIQLSPFELRRIESTENGRVVEWTTYTQVRVGDALDPGLFKLE